MLTDILPHIEILGIIFTLILSAWFAGVETVFLSFERMLLPSWLNKKKRFAKLLAAFTEHPERFIVTVLIGNNIVNVAYSSITTSYLTELGVAQFIILLSAPLLILLFGEVIPKSIGYQLSEQVVRPASAVIFAFRIILYPFARLIEKGLSLFQKKLKIDEGSYGLVFSRSDIAMVLKSVTSDLVNPQNSRHYANRVIKLGEQYVYDIMTPRNQVVAISVDDTVENLRRIIVESGFSRIPCYEDSIDNVIGVVKAKDILHNPETVRSALKPIEVVPDNLSVLNLLMMFRVKHIVFAAVIDEYGGFAGVVTTEDIVEELLGPIQDEYDKAEKGMLRLSKTTYLLDGKIKLSHLDTMISWKIPETRARTVGGLVLELAKDIPSKGDEFTVYNATLRVIRSTESEVQLIKLTLKPASSK